MGQLAIASNNRTDAATLAGGSWRVGVARSANDFSLANLQDKRLGRKARSSNALRTSTRFRAKLAKVSRLRAVALAAHNMSASARWRVRGGTAPLDLLFDDPNQKDSRVTFSGGDNGTVVDAKGRIVRITRTNLLLQSEDFTTTWTTSAVAVNYAVTASGPLDGAPATLQYLTPSAAAAAHYVSQSFTAVESGPHTVSVYAKARGYANFAVEIVGVGYAYFDADALAVTASSAVSDANVEPAAGGWCRGSITTNLTAGTGYTVNLYSAPQRNSAAAAGDAASGTYFFGAQAERNAVATDYIKTTAATVTATASGRISYSPTNLAAGVATQTIAGVTPGTYALVVDGAGASAVASGANVKNGTSAAATPGLPANVEVTATGAVALAVSGAPTALHLRECLGLLCEEARTNTVINSVCPGGVGLVGSWVDNGTAGDWQSNYATSPDGSKSATLGTQTGTKYIGASVTAGTAVIYSQFVKAVGATANYTVYADGPGVIAAGPAPTVTFNFGTGQFVSPTGPITGYGVEQWPNGWWRVWMGFTAAATDLANVHCYCNGDTLLWGQQVEAGAAWSSYIPTATTAITRAVDGAVDANIADWFVPGAGTLYVEAFYGALISAAPNEQDMVSISDGTVNNRIALRAVTDPSAPQLDAMVNATGLVQVDTVGLTLSAVGGVHKHALAFNTNDFADSIDGSLELDTSGTVPDGLNSLVIGSAPTTIYVRRVACWPQRLTNSQLQTITTSGPDAIGFNSGWLPALQFAFNSDTPDDWGEQYAAIALLPDADLLAQYLTVEIDDTANVDGYVQIGRLFAGESIQPAKGASRPGFADARDDLSSITTTPTGARFGAARKRPRTAKFALNWLTQAEADQIHELQALVGTLDEVLYVPDVTDMATTQRYGFLGYLRTLGALEAPYVSTRAVPFEITERV